MARTSAPKVAIVTGASSGIGKAAAIAFAKAGYSLVLAARREKALQLTANACQELGASALSVPTDVSDPKAVEKLHQEAVATYGGYEVWVNDAGVYVDGKFTETPLEATRRLFEVNLFGSIYGMRMALAQFEKQGHGVLINVSSIFGIAAGPYVSSYCASKYAIRALSQSLRAEFAGSPIKICTILPATIDTPLYRHCANFVGRKILPVKPIYKAEVAANAIVSAAQKPKDEIFVGMGSHLVNLSLRLFPKLTLKVLARQVSLGQFTSETVPISEGNLFHPIEAGTDTGDGWT